MQIKDSAISRIAIPYRGTCRGAARRIASLTALDGSFDADQTPAWPHAAACCAVACNELMFIL
jgi:hypothetical protein